MKRYFGSLLDRFVPEKIEDSELRYSWHHLGLMCFMVAVVHTLFTLQYLVLGAYVGAAVLSVTGALTVMAPWLAFRSRSLKLGFFLAVLGSLLAMGVLTLSKGFFALSTMMWFALLPFLAYYIIGSRWVWPVVIGALLVGSACYLLTAIGFHLGDTSLDALSQRRLDFISWLVFMLLSSSTCLALARAKDRAAQERAAVKALLHRYQRIEAMSDLAGGVAHEFNNILAVIKGTANYLRDEVEADSDIDECLVDIEHAASRGSEISDELLLFARGKADSHLGECSASDALGECVRLIHRVVGSGFDVQVDVPEHLPRVAVPARTIDQAVINLAINARDAMPEGGKIEVSAEVSAGFVVLHIRDQGPGMDQATQEKIFEPFFTTKTSGTGLGLAVVFGLLQQAQGRIEVESVIGEGTHFSLYLPVSNHSESEKAVAPQAVERSKESGQVMLVDDQASVRRMTKRILERAGYSVIEACNGKEALDLLDDNVGVKLLITDVRMPVLGGEELARELDRRKQGIPVLFITGFAGDSGAAARLLEMGTVLRKPFEPAELLDAAVRVANAA